MYRGLTLRQERFVAEYVAGKSAHAAAIAAGYGKTSARNSATDLLRNNPYVKEAIDKARSELRLEANYDAVAMVKELDDLIKEAKAGKQYNAAVKAVETKGKLFGLLIEKRDDRGASFQIHIGGIDAPASGPAPAPTALVAESIFD